MIHPFNPALYRRPRSVPDARAGGHAEGIRGCGPVHSPCRGSPRPWTIAGGPSAMPGRAASRSPTCAGSARRCSRRAPASPGGIEGFEPHGCDMIFDRDRPSCYASPAFADAMERGCPPLVIAGFAGEAACLATAIDGFHRGQDVTFLSGRLRQPRPGGDRRHRHPPDGERGDARVRGRYRHAVVDLQLRTVPAEHGRFKPNARE